VTLKAGTEGHQPTREDVPPPQEWPRRPRLLSVVCPVYNEEAGIAAFAERLLAVLNRVTPAYEVLFVEDDSTDRSLEILSDLATEHPGKIRVLSLSRRFGHQASLGAGFRYAAGDVVICMDSDLQHPPEMIPAMLHAWALGCQIVYTRRRQQLGRSVLKEQLSRWFYRVLDYVSDVPFEEGTSDFRLMDRVVVDALNRFPERALFYRGLVNWIGFRRTAMVYDAPARESGTSKYSLKRMMHMGMDALFSFSLLPLRFSYYLGGLAVLIAFVYGAVLVVLWVLGRSEVPGYTSLLLFVAFFGGLNLLCLGITAEYIGRIHEQTKGRPLYLIKEMIGFAECHEPDERRASRRPEHSGSCPSPQRR
jgi:polyisoprenyl-phosphate glycosyltransferase